MRVPLAIALGGVAIASVLAQQAPSTAEREAHRLQDLQALASGLKAPGARVAAGLATRGQKDFAQVYPNFDTEMASIREAIPHLSDAEIYLSFRRDAGRIRRGEQHHSSEFKTHSPIHY
jgi:hypothetical protein